MGYGSRRSRLVSLVHTPVLVRATSVSALARPGETELLECGTTEAGLAADAAARDNVKMLGETGTSGGSVGGVPGHASLLRQRCRGCAAPQGPLAWRRAGERSAAEPGCESPALHGRERDCNGERKTFSITPVAPPRPPLRKWGFEHMLSIALFT